MKSAEKLQDVVNELQGKVPEIHLHSIAVRIASAEDKLDALESAANWSLTSALVNAPEQAEQLCIDRHGVLYWSNSSRSWTKGVASGNYSASSIDRVISVKQKK